jgi:hypothetical protein
MRRQEAEGTKRSWTPQSEFPFPIKSANAESRLSLMDKHSIDIQALSQTTPALFGIGAEVRSKLSYLFTRITLYLPRLDLNCTAVGGV